MRVRNFSSLTTVLAGQFSLLCVGAVAAAGSVALYAMHEEAAFGSWSTVHYAADEAKLAAQKVVKLPPLEDAMPMSRIVHTADDAFSNSLRSGRVFRGSSKANNSSKYIRKVNRSNLIGSGAGDFFTESFGSYRPSRRTRAPQSGLYRTMCVRSCDGFMWPISFSTTSRNFGVDEKLCRNSCAAPTRLFYYENPGQEPADMVDLRGRSYRVLPTAWRYQQQHVSSCKCRPDPWEPQALARHQKYAALKKQGRLKSYLKQASRKARRLTRRASIGYVVTNSSFSTVGTLAGAVTPKVTRLATTRSRKNRSRKRASSSASWGNASGFSTKSYNKPYKSSGRRAFRTAFGTDR